MTNEDLKKYFEEHPELVSTLKQSVIDEIEDYHTMYGNYPNAFECKVVYHSDREGIVTNILVTETPQNISQAEDENYFFYPKNLEEFISLLANIKLDRFEDLPNSTEIYDWLNESEFSTAGEDFTIIDVLGMWEYCDPITKPFVSENELVTITRQDYYSFPCPLNGNSFTDDQMQELANTIGVHLERDYRLSKEEIEDENNDFAQDVLWELIENVALDMGMEYCDDVARKKERELFELANESISLFNEDLYLQFEKSIALNKKTYPEYDWIDGIQVVDDSVVVWLSSENSEDIFSLDIELFDEYTIDEMKKALQHTIKKKLV